MNVTNRGLENRMKSPVFIRIFPILFLLTAALALAGCAIVAATGKRHLTLIGEGQEIEMGAQSDEEIVQTLGLYPDESLQSYVQDLGARIAATTERPDLPWTFRVIDDDTINAFALPGGYIYVTRGILAHFENEAQLAGVLGHEIAHVTAKHSVIRLSRAMLAQTGLGIAQIIAPELEQFAPLAGAGLQLLFLSYSREDEVEADLLGVRYMENVGENPRELIDVMAMLSRASEGREGGMIPEWASTHPLPENRMDRIQEKIQALDDGRFRPVERDRYLARLDRLVYGKDPKEGFVRDSVFYHPALKFRYDFPAGWRILNQKRVVIGLSPEKKAAIQITLSDRKTLREAVGAFYQQKRMQTGSAQEERINSIPAVAVPFQARTKEGVIQGLAAFFAYGGRIYQIVGYSGASSWRQYAGDVRRSMTSFAELTDPAILGIEANRLNIVTVDHPSTLRAYYDRFPIPVPLEEIARLNQMQPDERLERGRRLKIVVGEKFR